MQRTYHLLHLWVDIALIFKYFIHGIHEKQVLVRLVVDGLAYRLGQLGLLKNFYTPDEF